MGSISSPSSIPVSLDSSVDSSSSLVEAVLLLLLVSIGCTLLGSALARGVTGAVEGGEVGACVAGPPEKREFCKEGGWVGLRTDAEEDEATGGFDTLMGTPPLGVSDTGGGCDIVLCNLGAESSMLVNGFIGLGCVCLYCLVCVSPYNCIKTSIYMHNQTDVYEDKQRLLITVWFTRIVRMGFIV